MNQWTIENLLQATQGDLFVAKGLEAESALSIVFHQVVTDSRLENPQGLYIALKGARFDGHAFAEQAVANGAVVVLVDHPLESVPAYQVVVADTQQALAQFAVWHRQRLTLEAMVGITGSNGKTTTKTLLKTVLDSFGQTGATEGNLNNELGVPRTLLSLTPQDQFAVVEMGANHPGEIAQLTQWVQPDVALITQVAEAHIEGFGSLAGVIDAKGEIFQGLSDQGQAVIPAEGVGTDVWQNQLSARGITTWTFGESAQAHVRVTQFEQQPEQICFNLVIRPPQQSEREVQLCLPMLGKHNAMNVAAVFAVCLALKIPLELVPAALQNYTGVAGRLAAQATSGGVTVLDDSYNANPSSVKAGIDTLVALRTQSAHPQKKTVLCLGEMAELGVQSEALHAQMGAYARTQGVDYLFTYGEATRAAVSAFGDQAQYFTSHSALLAQLQTLLAQEPVSAVLVKGSRSAGMEVIVEGLKRNV